MPFIEQLLVNLQETEATELRAMIPSIREIWGILLDRFNLTSVLSTFPVGISGLMTSGAPVKTPLGAPLFFEMPNMTLTFFSWLVLGLVGLLLVSLYLDAISRQVVSPKPAFSLQSAGWIALQLLLLQVLIVAAGILLTLPVMLIFAIFAMINAALAQASLTLMGFLALWMLLPLFFTPHAILIYRQNLFSAMATSARFSRAMLPGVGLFLLTVLVVAQGMDVIWRMAPETSWMALVGIIGHAFIITALWATSLVYFRGGMEYLRATLRQNAVPGIKI